MSVTTTDAPTRVLPRVTAAAAGADRRALAWRLGLAAVLAGGLALRLWGIAHGLPYVYNVDESGHFVPTAIAMFGHSMNPNYFINPPGYTYVLYGVLWLWYGGRIAVQHSYAADPTGVFVVARATAALLGVLGLGLLYLAGAKLFDRRAGVLAAAILSVAFLPVFYSHLALDDVPTLAPVGLGLWAAARILREGRTGDYVLAGIGFGLACAFKYTGGIVVLPILAAAAARHADGRRLVLGRLALTGVVALVAFLVANPYAVLDWHQFTQDLSRQASVSAGAAGKGKLGLSDPSGLHYYLWTATWGLGWAPAILAVVGAARLAYKHRWHALVLVPGVLAYYFFMGTEDRYFGRWLMPVFPMLCLLAAAGTLWLVGLGTSRWPAWRQGFVALGVVVLLFQGAVYSLHSDVVLSRPDTRNQLRAWMVAHVPAGSKVVIEPFVPGVWDEDVGHPLPGTADGRRWRRYPVGRSRIGTDGKLLPHHRKRVVYVEDYERTLRPWLVGHYVKRGYCWVVSGTTQSGRAFVAPRKVPRAIAYYRRLGRRATVVARFSPFDSGSRSADPVRFDFDWSFDFYPLAYAQPGPLVTVYRLHGGRCG